MKKRKRERSRQLTINIDTGKKKQTLTGFGVSGAWWAQVVGGWTETDESSGKPKRERIAELLFDLENGIGITQYRYNIGAGSKESGKGKYSDETRRASSFETAPGFYDWSRDGNAVWFMREAARLGADEIVMFVNSPIERLTNNHKAHLDKAGKTNLNRANYGEFAKYVLNVASHFKGEGLPIKYISPVNEPVWIWTGGQEGCHYRPGQVYKVMKTFAKELKNYPALKNVKLSGAENGDIRWFNKIYTYIMASKPLKDVTDAVDFHSYFLPVPSSVPGFIAKKLNDRLAFVKRYKRFTDKFFPGVPLKTSEWCHMQGGRDYGIDSAVVQAKVMAEDLIYLDVVSWQLWVALSPVDYCDGLIYYNEDRSFELTKRYYAFGNFSKFIRPGAVRIDAPQSVEDAYLLVFEQKDNYAAVVINYGESDKEIGFDLPARTARAYVTDKDNDLAEFAVSDVKNITLRPRSITTVIMEK